MNVITGSVSRNEYVLKLCRIKSVLFFICTERIMIDSLFGVKFFVAYMKLSLYPQKNLTDTPHRSLLSLVNFILRQPLIGCVKKSTKKFMALAAF
jgi:hypothetical protein